MQNHCWEIMPKDIGSTYRYAKMCVSVRSTSSTLACIHFNEEFPARPGVPNPWGRGGAGTPHSACIYNTIFLSIHHYGLHKGAVAEGARPFVVISFLVDGGKYGVTYAGIYPTSHDTY